MLNWQKKISYRTKSDEAKDEADNVMTQIHTKIDENKHIMAIK